VKRFFFEVAGSPVSQPRQRHRVIVANGKAFATNYTPAKDPVNTWKAYVREAAKAKRVEVLRGPVIVEISFYLPRPAALMRKKDPDGLIPHAGAKDLDNLYKAVTDALIGIAYQDDKQIHECHVNKWYHEKDGAPRAVITLMGE